MRSSSPCSTRRPACYLRFGVDKTTAVDIAKAAGISRATLYRRYGSHEAIFLAVLTRESEAMMLDSERHLAHIADPAERIVEGMLFAIGEITRRPVHAAVFTTDSAGWAATRALRVDALRRLGEAGIRPMLAGPRRRARSRSRPSTTWSTGCCGS